MMKMKSSNGFSVLFWTNKAKADNIAWFGEHNGEIKSLVGKDYLRHTDQI
jgi:hypothetical protein